MRKSISGMLAAIMILIAVLSNCNYVYAEDKENYAGGSDIASAVPIEFGEEYTNKANPKANFSTTSAPEIEPDYNYYSFTTKERGQVKVGFWGSGQSSLPVAQKDLLSKADIRLGHVLGFNPSENTDNKLTFDSTWYNLNAGTEENPGTYVVGLNPGTYYIGIYSTVDTSYHMKIEFSANSTCEIEQNDSFESANTIALNQAYSAYTWGKVTDSDYYQFTPSADGYVTLSVKGDVESSVYGVKFFSSDETTSPLYSDNITSNMVGITSVKLGVAKDKKYYVLVTGSKTSSDASKKGGAYSIQVDFVGASNYEKEYNNSFEKANAISANTPVTGIISYGADIDYYSFVSTEDGVITAKFNHDAITGDGTSSVYSIQIYDGARKLVYDTQGMSGSKISYTTAEIPINKATTYYFVIKGGSKAVNTYYSFEVSFLASDSWEKEPNDSCEKATPILSGKTYNGNTTTESDVDYYLIEAVDGYLTIGLNQKCGTSKRIYTLVVSNADNKAIYKTLISGTEESYTSAKLGVKAGKYYISILKGESSYNGKYQLTVTSTKASNWEVEDNNDFSTANYIKVDKPVYGSTMSDADSSTSSDPYDFYKFTINKNMYVNVNLTHDKIDNSESMWYVCLYNTKSKTVGGSGIYVRQANSYSESKIVFLKKGTYYVKVAALTEGVGHEYKLTVSKITCKAPSVTDISLKTSKKGKKVAISWKPVAGASKYYIYRSTSKKGKYSKVKTIYEVGTLSYTDSSVKKGKTYYYKMAAVVQKKTSKLSKAKSIKVK